MRIANSSEISNLDSRKIDQGGSFDFKPSEKRVRRDSTGKSEFFSTSLHAKEEHLPYIKKIRDENHPPFVAQAKREYHPSPYAAPVQESLPPIHLPPQKKLLLHDRPERNNNRPYYKEGRPFQPIILFSKDIDITREEPSRYRQLVESNIERLEESSKVWESALSKLSKPISDKSLPVLSSGVLPTLPNDSKVLPSVRSLIESNTLSIPSPTHESKPISSPTDTHESNALSRSRYLDIKNLVSQETPYEYRSEAYTNQPKPSFFREGPEKNSSTLSKPTDETFLPAKYTRPTFVENPPSRTVAPTDPSKRKRHNLPKEVTAILLKWYGQNIKNPYPDNKEKEMLMSSTGLTRVQVQDWFINARRRWGYKEVQKRLHDSPYR